MLAFAAADALGSPRSEPRAGGRALAWIVGISGGWAVVTEFQAAIPAIFIGLLALDGARRSSISLSTVIAPIAAGVAIAAAPLLVYNALAFGSPLHVGYSSQEGF